MSASRSSRCSVASTPSQPDGPSRASKVSACGKRGQVGAKYRHLPLAQRLNKPVGRRVEISGQNQNCHDSGRLVL
jgi:hypothetical protein